MEDKEEVFNPYYHLKTLLQVVILHTLLSVHSINVIQNVSSLIMLKT